MKHTVRANTDLRTFCYFS